MERMKSMRMTVWGIGSMKNASSKKESYKKSGIGMIKREDVSKRKNTRWGMERARQQSRGMAMMKMEISSKSSRRMGKKNAMAMMRVTG